MPRKHLNLEQKMQIILRITLNIPDREIANEFHVSRSRITQIRLYEIEKIRAEYQQKYNKTELVKMLDNLVKEDAKNGEDS